MSNETETEEHEYPNIVERFKEVFQKLGIKKGNAYVDHCAKGDLEDLEDVEQKLYEMGLHPSLRNQVINFWAAEIKQPVPKKLQKRLAQERGTTPRDGAEGEREPEKYSVDPETGSIRAALSTEKTAMTWDEAQQLSSNIKKELSRLEKKGAKQVTYVYEPDTRQVRMAKEGEIGGTLDQAKELKKMAEEGRKEGDEPPFILDDSGNWTLNPKGRITGTELMALDSIRRAQEKGEPIDPLQVLSQTAEKIKVYQGVLGGAAKELPEWMTDPVKFIETVRTISGEPKEGGGLEDLKAQIGDLTKKLDDMKEERHRDEIAGMQSQIRAQNERMAEILDRVEDMKKPVTGRTELDIIHEVATEGIQLLGTEASSMRGLVKEVMIGGRLPPLKSTEEREERKGRLRRAVAVDREIEELGRKLFFGEDVPLPKAAKSPEAGVVSKPASAKLASVNSVVTPSCYVAGEDGRCVSQWRGTGQAPCEQCQWR